MGSSAKTHPLNDKANCHGSLRGYMLQNQILPNEKIEITRVN